MSEIEFGHVPLVKVTRGDSVESVHYGAMAVVDSRGGLRASVGSPEASGFLRSAAKPLQILPLLASGAADRFRLSSRELAVIISSHNGERMHLDAVRSVLKKAGVAEGDLRCGAHPPFDRRASDALLRAGKRPSSLHNNCSGKHAGMLALARFWETPVRTYLSPSHPVQKAILKVLSEYTGVPEPAILRGTDGCSAPTFALSLRDTALAYARLVEGRFGTPEERAASQRAIGAMRKHPELIGGTGRLCTALIRAIGRSFVSKVGAEGFFGMAYLDGKRGVGIALKVGDGNGERARTTVAVELLVQLGLLERGRADRILFVNGLPRVRNVRGTTVGRIAPLFQVA